MKTDTIHLLPAAWIGTEPGPFSQEVSLQTVTLTSYSKVDLQPTASIITQLAKDGVRGLYAENDGGTLTVTAYILADETDENGNPVITAIDTYTLTKETGKNVATFEGDNTTSEFEYILGVVPSFLRLAIYAFTNWLPKFLIMVPELLDVVINEGTF